ncbi:MAG: hypothetical protein RIS70_1758 [Planctomycetota bacterium]
MSLRGVTPGIRSGQSMGMVEDDKVLANGIDYGREILELESSNASSRMLLFETVLPRLYEAKH